MKKPFKIRVTAKTHEDAFKRSRAPGKTAWKAADDAPLGVRVSIMGKLSRVEENAGLYADKVLEYKTILEKFDGNKDRDEAVIDGMLEHGDLRTDNATSCAVRKIGSDKFVVFGYDFT